MTSGDKTYYISQSYFPDDVLQKYIASENIDITLPFGLNLMLWS